MMSVKDCFVMQASNIDM